MTQQVCGNLIYRGCTLKQILYGERGQLVTKCFRTRAYLITVGEVTFAQLASDSICEFAMQIQV